jgi:holo-[acyl-carrier protein] synthase
MKDIGVVNEASGEPRPAAVSGGRQRLDEMIAEGQAAEVLLTAARDFAFPHALVVINPSPLSGAKG